MKYLLDTHTFLWFIDDNKKLGSEAKEVISNLTNNIFLSRASLWEIIIKSSIGKLELSKGLDEIERVITFNNFQLVDIDFTHLKTLYTLPKFHRDPFDRLIVAQAIFENFILITDDSQMKNYPVKILA